VSGTHALKQLIPSCRSVISAASGAEADIHLDEFGVFVCLLIPVTVSHL
jgi:hypothetical protein